MLSGSSLQLLLNVLDEVAQPLIRRAVEVALVAAVPAAGSDVLDQLHGHGHHDVEPGVQRAHVVELDIRLHLVQRSLDDVPDLLRIVTSASTSAVIVRCLIKWHHLLLCWLPRYSRSRFRFSASTRNLSFPIWNHSNISRR